MQRKLGEGPWKRRLTETDGQRGGYTDDLGKPHDYIIGPKDVDDGQAGVDAQGDGDCRYDAGYNDDAEDPCDL